MNWAHIHLMLNHIPVVGTGLVILLLIVALARKSKELTNVTLIFTILISLATIPVYLTGEPAEEVIEDMPGIREELIEEHEEQAEIAFIFIEVTGFLALIALVTNIYSQKIAQRMALLTLLALIVSGGLMAWTANLGGKIQHEEIRSDSTLQIQLKNRENEND
ncbi:MAG: hypothetical protein KatS3mg078_2024 [Deltaproteobacteria bacterium]|jgi:NADH:ubiquinone oxidoreductase subunit 4 (subunit M)|nr:hypothetical protein HRbin37_02102 [bacterium HR37]GIW48147.1 MAG: hypothetical protein KatS3mg078_2024 [Deltaproteobacteria bacterium]